MDHISEKCSGIVGFELTVLEVVGDAISDDLWSLGVLAIEEAAGPPGHLLFRSSFGVDREETTQNLRRLSAKPGVVDWRVVEIDPRITESWKEFVRPTQIDPDLVIVPAWLQDVELHGARTVIRIDPGGTFGLGDHPTTHGSLRLLSRFLRQGDSVLDVGCGSGVLGITALRLGASRAVGIDINPASDSVSIANARLNSVEDKWSVLLHGLDRMQDSFDVIVANILAPTLRELAPELRRLLARQGTLVISGILQTQVDSVVAALVPLDVTETISIEGWVTVALRHHSTRASISSP